MPNRFNPDVHHRRSIRLPGYDYTLGGAYFLTLCTHQREPLFGQIANGVMHLNDSGKIVQDEWLRTAVLRHEIQLDSFVVMPNHLHAVILFAPTAQRVGDGLRRGAQPCAPTEVAQISLGSLVAGFKASITKQINQVRHNPGAPVWQRNYYEHLIRDQPELDRIREYIAMNPSRWSDDDLNPANGTGPPSP